MRSSQTRMVALSRGQRRSCAGTTVHNWGLCIMLHCGLLTNFQ
jgi:hypothetical protein